MTAVGKPKVRVPSASPRSPTADMADRVGEIRQQIELARERYDIVAASPRPLAEAEPLIDKAIALAASQVQPVVGYLASSEPGGAHELVEQMQALGRPVAGAPAGYVSSTKLTPFDFLCAIAPDQVRSWLRPLLAEHYRTLPAVLPADERKDRLAEIEREIAALEREEAALLWAAESAGVRANWRADQSPVAVLGLA